MTLTLSPELEAMIREKVDSGDYATADEVIEAAVRLLDERDRDRQRLLAALAEGEEGDAIPYTPELMRQLRAEADEMFRQGIEPDPDVCP